MHLAVADYIAQHPILSVLGIVVIGYLAYVLWTMVSMLALGCFIYFISRNNGIIALWLRFKYHETRLVHLEMRKLPPEQIERVGKENMEHLIRLGIRNMRREEVKKRVIARIKMLATMFK